MVVNKVFQYFKRSHSKLRTRVSTEQGQSIIEFVLMLPVMVGLFVIMVRTNTAIQRSIVNQKYLRAHAHWLTFNSSVYPEASKRTPNYIAAGYNRLILGVSENTPPSEEFDNEYQPEPSYHFIGRNPKDKAVRGPAGEVDERLQVRIRNAIALCTQSSVIRVNNQFVPVTAQTLSQIETTGAIAFNYCRSPRDEQ